jgi:hypothetical protein
VNEARAYAAQVVRQLRESEDITFGNVAWTALRPAIELVCWSTESCTHVCSLVDAKIPGFFRVIVGSRGP